MSIKNLLSDPEKTDQIINVFALNASEMITTNDLVTLNITTDDLTVNNNITADSLTVNGNISYEKESVPTDQLNFDYNVTTFIAAVNMCGVAIFTNIPNIASGSSIDFSVSHANLLNTSWINVQVYTNMNTNSRTLFAGVENIQNGIASCFISNVGPNPFTEGAIGILYRFTI